jgi:hypothetical protein
VSDGQDLPMPLMEPAGFDRSVDPIVRIAKVDQLLSSDDSILSCRQARHSVVRSQFAVHSEDKCERGMNCPPAAMSSSQKSAHSAGKCERRTGRGSLEPREGRGNICSPG